MTTKTKSYKSPNIDLSQTNDLLKQWLYYVYVAVAKDQSLPYFDISLF